MHVPEVPVRGSGTDAGGDAAFEGVKPGTLTDLLKQIAQAPAAELGSSWDSALYAGATVGRFELVREVGRGGFGVVWEARDRELGRSVALKAVRAGAQAALREERLLREAEAAARLSHPNIVTLFDAGRTEQGPYLVLELLRGRTLEARTREGPMPVRDAVHVAVEVAKGLAHAHGQGVVHRDLKPANVFLCDDGQVKMLDLGLAHAFGRRFADGGTRGYMAPEQEKGAPEDERTDVYALGVMLFELLSGRLPFPEGRKNGSPPALDTPTVPALGDLVGRMLALDPTGRPRDANEVLASLVEIETALAARPSAPGPVHVRRRPRLRRAALIAGAAVLGALMGVAAVVRPWRTEEPEKVRAAGDRITVAVADFTNETSERELDSISGLLTTALEQSSGLRVVTRSRMFEVLKQMGKADVARIDEPLAREVGRKTGTDALLLATIRKLGDSYVVDLRALDPVKDEYLFTLHDRASGKEAIFELVDRLGEASRQRLKAGGGQGAQPPRPIASITTGDMRAWDLVFRARQASDRYEDVDSEKLLHEALAIDPDFALAHYLLGLSEAWENREIHHWPHLYGAEPDGPRRQSRIDEAARRADRLPEKERLSLLAAIAWRERRFMESLRIRDQVAEAYPLDKDAVFLAGNARYGLSETGDSIPYFERALQLDPSFMPAFHLLCQAIRESGRAREYLPWIRDRIAATRHPDVLDSLGRALLAAGEVDEGMEVLKRAWKVRGYWFAGGWRPGQPFVPAWRAVFLGQADEVEVELRAALDRRSDYHPGVYRSWTSALAITLVVQGRIAEARARYDDLRLDQLPRGTAVIHLWLAAAARRPDGLRAAQEYAERQGAFEDPGFAGEAFVALATGGDVAAAGRLAARVRENPAWKEFAPVDRGIIDALAAWGSGAPDVAERELRAVAARSDVYVRYLGLVLLGQLAHEQGDCRAAATALEDARGLDFTLSLTNRFWTYPLLLQIVSECHERNGDRARARERNDELLRMWKRADRDLPLLAEATALRERLAAR